MSTRQSKLDQFGCFNCDAFQASLQSVVDTALRWDARHVKRVPSSEGARWEDVTWLVCPQLLTQTQRQFGVAANFEELN